jgi:putative spermidine/putrescine transport system substrate-binding protein
MKMKKLILSKSAITKIQGIIIAVIILGASAGVGYWYLVLLPSQTPRELVVSGYGAEFEDLIKRVVIPPFEKQYNAKITYDGTGSSLDHYAKLKASGGDPGWDVTVMVDSEVAMAAKEGLLVPITEDKVPNLKNVYPKLQQYCGQWGAVHYLEYQYLLYNTNKIKKAPESWEALWDPQYKGHVVIKDSTDYGGAMLIVTAAELAGGSVNNIDPGIEKLRQLKPNLLTIAKTSAAMVPYLEKEECWIAPYWTGRSLYYKFTKGLPIDVTIPKEGTYSVIVALAIPKGAKNKDLAYKYIDFYLTKEIQRDWSAAYTVAPARLDAARELPPELASRIATTEQAMASIKHVDPTYLAQVRDQWIEKWKKAMA